MASDTSIPEWELEIGLPQPDDPFIQQYLSGREALIDQEKSTRSDASFRSSLAPLAQEACAIVARIRDDERRTIWSQSHNDTSTAGSDVPEGQASANVFPGMMFGLARAKMEETKLWQIVRKMPKGALLHAHFDAMVDAEWLIGSALETEGMAIVTQGDLASREAREKGTVLFQYVKNPPAFEADGLSIWDKTYGAGKFVSAKQAADSFPEGGREGFTKWLSNKCMITKEESLDHHLGLDVIWRKFGSCFPIVNSMLFYEPIFRVALQRILKELLDDGIRWVDFRIAFVFQYRRQGCVDPEDGYGEMLRVFGEEVRRFQATEEGNRFWGCRFIWTTLRVFDKKGIVESMMDCISTKKRFPDLISGFDLVGQEDMGRPLVDLTPELFWFRKRCLEEGVDIPFFFHAGECLGDGDETDENLFDAVLLGTRRIGHGFSLYKHPLLIEMVKQKSILIESCPISNEILRLTSSVTSHPLPALLARGVKVALCNDDPAILGHGKNGMTHDFWQALQGWENLGLAGLGSLAENSVRYAAYNPDQPTKEWIKDVKDGVYGQGVRAERMRDWTAEWNRFCEWILMEFAVEYGSDGDGEGEEEEEEEEKKYTVIASP
ncbi:MAG: hypothetical protein Q9187_005726 [Circinaria calcarea]